MQKSVVSEHFPDILKFLETIESRPDNGRNGLHRSSHKKDNEWSGMDYIAALDACKNGMPDMKTVLERGVNAYTGTYNCNSNRIQNDYIGYSPNIARAIIGYPKSMKRRVTTPKKTKTIHILYGLHESCGVEAKTIERASIATLNTINTLELNGYRCKLDIIPYSAHGDDNNYAFCSISLKEYSQPFDFLKLSFPLTQVAMFRRFGFRWIETQPDITGDWYGYGIPIRDENDIKQHVKVDKNAKFMNVTIWNGLNFDVSKMLEKIERGE